MNVYIADELTKVFVDGEVNGNPLIPASDGVKLYGCGDEIASFQLVIAAADKPLNEVTLEFQLLRDGSKTISADVFCPYLVGFVHTPATAYNKWKFATWWPDPLFPMRPFRVLQHDFQPVWINLHIPQGKAGSFSGAVVVYANGQKRVQIPIHLRVWGFNLPKNPPLINGFDFSLAEKVSGFMKLYGSLESSGFDVLAKFLRYLREHTVNNLFYNHLLFDSGLLKAKKKKGHFVNDFTRASKIIKLFKKLEFGFNFWSTPIWPNAKPLFDIYPSIEHFRHLGQKVYQNPGFNQHLLDLATDFYQYLKKQSLSSQSFAYLWDEPHKPWHGKHMAMLSKRFKKMCPEARQLVAIGQPSMIEEVLKRDLPIDIIVGHLSYYDANLRDRIIKSGRQYWWYTSNWPSSHISFWVDEPSLHHRIIYWLTWRYQVPGFLYWNTNVWNSLGGYGYANIEAKHKMDWPYSNWNVTGTSGNTGAADGQLLYPGPDGPIGSIRFEIIRHGYQDHTCLTSLESAVEKATGQKKYSGEKLLTEVKKRIGTLRRFTHRPEVLQQLRQEIGHKLEELNNENN